MQIIRLQQWAVFCYHGSIMNQLKTIILLGSLTGLILAIGYYVGGNDGMLIALILAGAMNFASYWWSDKIVLAMYRGRAVNEAQAPQLHRMVSDLAARAGIPMPRLYIIDLPVPNAFATGRNPSHAAVAVSTSLMHLLDEDELRGVLAHELSHVKNRDILVASVAATLAGAISYIAQFAFYFGGRRDSREGGAAGSIALLLLTPLMATLLHLAVSRSREYLADETGARLAGSPRGLASALRKLHASSRTAPLAAQPKYEATAHLFIVNPFKPGLLMSLFSTHPAMDERIARLERMVY